MPNRAGIPSASRLRAIGKRLRRQARGEDVDPELLEEDDALIDVFRAAHSEPMNSFAMGMRSMCRTLGLSEAVVSQRTKTKATIREKLTRHEDSHDLSRMHDIGGVRVVLPDLQQLHQLQDRALGRYGSDLVKVIDYVQEPRASGYRAIHLIVKRHGLPIEIQLRTVIMHRWAEDVERWSRLMGINYKQDGEGPFQRFMVISSLADQALEKGDVLPQDLVDEANYLAECIYDEVETVANSRGTLF